MGQDTDLAETARLLAVSPVPLWPDTNGYALRVVNLVRELSARWDVVLVAAASPPEHDRTSSLGVHTHVPVKVRGNIATMPWQLETQPLCAEALRAVQTYGPSCALLWSGIEFLAFDLDVPVVLGDRIDCATLAQVRNLRGAPSLKERWHSLTGAAQAAAYERKIVRELSVTTVVGEADARMLRRISNRDSVHVVPNGATPGRPPSDSDETELPTVVFSGALGFRPNADAARFFATEIFPHVKAQVRDARFVVVGWGTEAQERALSSLPGVEVHSNVPDMGEELRAAWVTVAPMRSGCGIKNKVLEAWAVGKPVVMTSLATNGLAPDYDRGSLIADAPRDFAGAVARLLLDKTERRRLGRGGYDLVPAHYTWSQAAETVTAILRGVRGTDHITVQPEPNQSSPGGSDRPSDQPQPV